MADRTEPGNTAGNCPISTRLRGPLDVGALIESLTDIVRRHAVPAVARLLRARSAHSADPRHDGDEGSWLPC
jgi:hypothetical protein